MKPLPKSFYERKTVEVAKDLLGKLLVRTMANKKAIGKIVETEAYYQDDPASHSFRGKTKRNSPMFETPGRAYVYFIYGNHYCLNVVTEKNGTAGAVLIRALEPIKGIEIMKRNRKTDNIYNLTNGPGKLTQALAINKEFNRADLSKGKLFITEGSQEKFNIKATKRIGIKEATGKLLRFYIADNKFVSSCFSI